MDDDILTQQYFLRGPDVELKELETDFITVGANSSIVLGLKGDNR